MHEYYLDTIVCPPIRDPRRTHDTGRVCGALLTHPEQLRVAARGMGGEIDAIADDRGYHSRNVVSVSLEECDVLPCLGRRPAAGFTRG